MENNPLHVAYFSMEFAFDDRFKNYAGGLGVLAADTAYSFADLGIPAACVTLWYHQDDDRERALDPSPYMRKRDETIEVQIEDRKVKIVIWQYDVVGKNGHVVPVFFLSSHTPENTRWDRDLTKYLYASDRYTRLGQEAILGIGGYRALKKLGCSSIDYYHMNEGHTALIGLERLRSNGFNMDVVRSKSTFTTHTPVPAGHDYFDYHLAQETLGNILPANIKDLATQDRLGMTQLAMNLSIRTNSVARRHQEVTREMFPGHEIENVTNGMYHPRWAGDGMKDLFSKRTPNWEQDPAQLENIFSVPDQEIVLAHKQQKKYLIEWINSQPQCFRIENMLPEDYFDEDTLTIGFARRFVPYKRPGLIFRNLDRLREIGFHKLQFVFAGKCHPDDMFCNKLRDSIAHYSTELRGQIKVAVIPDYNLDIAKRLVTGSDVWLNNPIPPREASGTSGMKAALNGALNLSILDGWWIEGFERRPLAGWGVAGSTHEDDFGGRDDHDASELLSNLNDVIHTYYDNPQGWQERMKHAIALAGYFNTHRMVNEYQERIWKS
jgi:starch phosphorylase